MYEQNVQCSVLKIKNVTKKVAEYKLNSKYQHQNAN